MHASINGVLMPAEEARVSVFDRSFCYGDGLFETLRVHQGKPLLWVEHFCRFDRAVKQMSLRCPLDPEALLNNASALIETDQIQEGVLRLHLSRGVGPRGFSFQGADAPVLVMTVSKLASAALSAAPRRVIVAETARVPMGDRFSWFKSANRIHYIAARSEAEISRHDDAIVLNTKGEVADFSSASLMLLRNGILIQPPLSSGRLEGIMSAWVAKHSGLKLHEEVLSVGSLAHAEAILYLSSVAGITWVSHLAGSQIKTSENARHLQQLWNTSIHQKH